MFSSWDLVRPRFWYPMSSLEQSMMEIEQMRNSMLRPRSLFDMRPDVFAAPRYAEDKKRWLDDDFFVDLPVASHTFKPTPFGMVPKQDAKALKNKESADNASSDTDISTDMEVDDEGNENVVQTKDSATKSLKTSKKVQAKDDKTNEKHHRNKNKQLCRESYKVTPAFDRESAPNSDGECRNFSSYSFSSSSILDDKGRQVTTTRRRYEDSSGRLKAVHEREIGGKKLCTTWRRQSKDDEGQHESMCSSGSPEEFEALWQQTPFGKAQKKTVKGRLQSEADVEKGVASTLEDNTIDEIAAKKRLAKKVEKVSTEDE